MIRDAWCVGLDRQVWVSRLNHGAEGRQPPIWHCTNDQIFNFFPFILLSMLAHRHIYLLRKLVDGL